MSQLQIIARQITNLTDARYFAAKSVDFLAFELAPGQRDRVEASFVRQVRHWISGPRIMAGLNGFETTSQMEKMLDEVEPDALLFGPFADTSLFRAAGELPIFREIQSELLSQWSLPPGHRLIIHFNDKQELAQIQDWIRAASVAPDAVYLEGPLGVDTLDPALLEQIAGIVLKGSEEEKTGFKSFDELDTFFDRLEELAR